MKKNYLKKFTKNDYEILRVMVEKGTTNAKEIAQELNISDKTIRNRISLYKEMEVFKKHIVINPKAFGYSLRIDFFLVVSKMNVIDVTNFLLKNFKHSITYIGRHWGDNISMQCVFKDGEEAESFEKELKLNNLIKNYDSSIVPIIFKDTYDWRPHQDNFNITNKGMEELKQRRKQQLFINKD